MKYDRPQAVQEASPPVNLVNYFSMIVLGAFGPHEGCGTTRRVSTKGAAVYAKPIEADMRVANAHPLALDEHLLYIRLTT